MVAACLLPLISGALRLSAQQTGSPAADTIPVTDTIPADTIPADTALAGAESAAGGPDSIAAADTAATESKGEAEISISSGKALLYSAIIPGGGQFYNRKYWKIPIVYGGFIALGIAIKFNQDYYSEFVRELNYRGDGDPLTVPKYDEASIPNSRIIEARNYYRRYRDMCIIGVGVLYGLNIVDAYVDAELSNFDISQDLSMKVGPSLQYDPTFAAVGMGAAPGFSLTFGIR